MMAICRFFERSLLLAGSAVAVIFVSACGAGGDSVGGDNYTPPLYGSIAINRITGAAGIASNYDSQRSANDSALGQCGSGCVTVLEFGSSQCGALSRASNTPTFGWASNNKSYDARVNSLNQCVQNKGQDCQVILDKCNGS